MRTLATVAWVVTLIGVAFGVLLIIAVARGVYITDIGAVRRWGH